MTDPSDGSGRAGRAHPTRGEHEPGPSTVFAAELLARRGEDHAPHHRHGGGAGAGLPDSGDDGFAPAPESRDDNGPAASDADSGAAASGVGEDAAEDRSPAPILTARGLGLHTGRGWVFRDVDLAVAPGSVTALIAAGGSGRSALLLALTGRMRVTEGTLTVAGRSVSAEPRAARARTAVARIADLIVPEDRLTVDESVVERCLIDGVRPSRGRDAFRKACEQMSRSLESGLLVEHLPAVDRAILALALASLRPADVIVLDDTDRHVTADGEREIYRAALRLARTGPAVITTTSRREALPAGVDAVELTEDER